MKKIIFLCCFLLISSLSFAQDCTLVVTNMTGAMVSVGAETTLSTPNMCPPVLWGAEGDPLIASGATVTILLGTVALYAPPIRPFKIYANCLTGGSCTGSWQVNTCWYSACISNYINPYVITITYCSDYETHVTIT